MSHHSGITPGAMPEVRGHEPEAAPRIDRENRAVIVLLHSWREEDATDDSQELERRDAETDELLRNLNRNRNGERP